MVQQTSAPLKLQCPEAGLQNANLTSWQHVVILSSRLADWAYPTSCHRTAGLGWMDGFFFVTLVRLCPSITWPVNGQSVGGLSQLTWSKNLMNDNPEGWQIIMDNTNAKRSTEKPWMHCDIVNITNNLIKRGNTMRKSRFYYSNIKFRVPLWIENTLIINIYMICTTLLVLLIILHRSEWDVISFPFMKGAPV